MQDHATWPTAAYEQVTVSLNTFLSRAGMALGRLDNPTQGSAGERLIGTMSSVFHPLVLRIGGWHDAQDVCGRLHQVSMVKPKSRSLVRRRVKEFEQ